MSRGPAAVLAATRSMARPAGHHIPGPAAKEASLPQSPLLRGQPAEYLEYAINATMPGQLWRQAWRRARLQLHGWGRPRRWWQLPVCAVLRKHTHQQPLLQPLLPLRPTPAAVTVPSSAPCLHGQHGHLCCHAMAHTVVSFGWLEWNRNGFSWGWGGGSWHKGREGPSCLQQLRLKS